MKFYEQLLDALTEQTNKAMIIKPNDYLDDEGFWVCGDCGQPMQMMRPDGKCKVAIKCLCDDEQIRLAKENEDAKHYVDSIKDNRSFAFPDKSLQENKFVQNAPKSPVEHQLLNYISSFDPSSKYGVALYGDSMSGKTYLTSCVLNMIIDDGFTAKMISGSTSVEKSAADSFIEKFKDLDIIAFDNLPENFDSNYLISTLINYRNDSGKPIIINTTCDLGSNHANSYWSKTLKYCIKIKLFK